MVRGGAGSGAGKAGVKPGERVDFGVKNPGKPGVAAAYVLWIDRDDWVRFVKMCFSAGCRCTEVVRRGEGVGGICVVCMNKFPFG